MTTGSNQPKSRHVLVTGGAGFIGANLVRLLLAKGWRVSVADNLSSGPAVYIGGLDVELLDGDVLDREFVSSAVRGKDAIVHLAAQTGVPNSVAAPRRDFEVNAIGTLNVLEAARECGIGRFVFASSNAPLGRQAPPASEDKAPLPISPYGASKLTGEAYCLAYHGSWGLGTVILRFANVYGPYSGRKSSVVARFLGDIMSGNPITIYGGGNQTRDFVYVGDLCEAVSAALDSPVSGEVLHIATGHPTSVRNLVDVMERVCGVRIERRFAPERTADIGDNYSVVEKAKRLLGWEARTGLEEGLARTWQWFKAQHTNTA